MRADAARNRERLLEAAAAAFAEQGLDVGVAEIARRAGVGHGTLFRHFPTKDDLIGAIVDELIAEVLAEARAAAADPDPWAGLVRFMTWSLEAQRRDRALKEAFRHRAIIDPAFDDARRQILDEVAVIVGRAQAAGAVREDLAPQDIPFLLAAVAGALDHFPRAGPEMWRRYLGIVLDGLRPEGATRPEIGPPPEDVVVRLRDS